MESYDVTVRSVYARTSDSGTRFFKVEVNLDDGGLKTFNVFEEDIANALNSAKESRQKINITLEQNGKWTNFKGLNTAVTTASGQTIEVEPPKPRGGFGGGKADPMKARSIERQCALKATVELITAGQVDIVDWERVASSMANWIARSDD